MWLWHKRDAEIFDGDDDCCCWALDKLPPDWFEVLAEDVPEVEEDEQMETVEREFNALESAVKVVSGATLALRIFSPSSGVVNVGDDDAEVVTDAVVMPMRVVVTMVSMRGDESAVRVVYVGVGANAAVGVVDPPPVESFFSILLFSAGADDEPPRHGKQQRNSVERNIARQFHD